MSGDEPHDPVDVGRVCSRVPGQGDGDEREAAVELQVQPGRRSSIEVEDDLVPVHLPIEPVFIHLLEATKLTAEQRYESILGSALVLIDVLSYGNLPVGRPEHLYRGFRKERHVYKKNE